MRRHLNQRDNNYETVTDRHGAKAQHDNRRTLVRVKRDKPSGITYVNARVRWNFTYASGIVDECEAEDTDTPGTLYWVDGKEALSRLSPSVFGDVTYRCEVDSTATRSSVTRTLIRPVGITTNGGTGNAFKLAAITRASSTSGTIGQIYSDPSVSLNIQTSINGSYVDNFLPMYVVPGGADGYSWDCMLPPRFVIDGDQPNGDFPFVVPDVFQLARKRGGVVASAAGASSGVSLATSIDFGEFFTIEMTYGNANKGTKRAGAAVGYVRLTFYQTSSTVYNMIGHGCSIGLATWNDFTTNPDSLAGGGGYANTTTFVASFDGINVGGTAVTSVTSTITFTNDSNGRITNIAATAVQSALIEGGRGAWITGGPPWPL